MKTELLQNALYFSVDGKHFENGTFRKRCGLHDNHVISLTKFDDCCVFKFSRRCVDEKHLVRFLSAISVDEAIKGVFGDRT